KALSLDPYLSGALYGLALNLRRQADSKEAAALLAKFEGLQRSDWQNLTGIKYSEMGRYADVIGRPPQAGPPRNGPLPLFQPREGLKVELAAGARWARASDFGKGEVAEVRALVRTRFGGTVVVLDYNRDGRPDLFVAGAVLDKGQVRDLLLR